LLDSIRHPGEHIWQGDTVQRQAEHAGAVRLRQGAVR
jgi:hypothetical protein